MTYSLLILQKTVFDRLSAVSAVTSLLAAGAASIFDYVKQDSVFPYIVIGEHTGIMDGDKVKTGQDCTVTIHVFTKGRGRKETQTIMKAVVEALDRQESTMTAAGFEIVLCNFEFSDIFIDTEDDSNFYPHGVLRFRFLMREA